MLELMPPVAVADANTRLRSRCFMAHVIYRVVRHDEGWAYTANGTFSERFNSHKEALEAAQRAAREQRMPGNTHVIEYEDAAGKWHSETASGSDRPETGVEDSPSSA